MNICFPLAITITARYGIVHYHVYLLYINLASINEIEKGKRTHYAYSLFTGSNAAFYLVENIKGFSLAIKMQYTTEQSFFFF